MNASTRQAGLILRNDLRLFWRGLGSTKLRWLSMGGVLLGGLLLLLHAVAILGFLFLHRMMHRDPPLAAEALVWTFFTFAMIGTAANQVIAVVFERADFDFLLSAPVSPRAVLWARLATIALSTFLSVGLLLMPLIDGAAIGFSVRYLAGYLVWALLALVTGSLGFWVTLALVRWLGIRRARTVSQVVAALLGASVLVITQAHNFVAPSEQPQFLSKMGRAASAAGFGLVARAGQADGSALAGLVLVAALLSILTGRQLGKLLVTGVQAGGESLVSRPAKAHRHQWTAGVLRAAFRKDLRLILRDPLLLAQTLPTLFYLVPSIFPFARMIHLRILAPAALGVSCQLAFSLAIVSAWGEECIDLVRMSPTPEPRLRVTKMAAALVPAMSVTVLCALVLASAGSPWLALLTLLMTFACGCGCTRLAIVNIQPTPRRDLLKRRGNRWGGTWQAFAEMGLVLLGASGLGLECAESVAPRAIGVILLGLMLLGVVACFVLLDVREAKSAGT